MIKKSKEVEIDKDDPFKNDAFSRKKDAEILTHFVSKIETPYVMALDSDWGKGKTTFLKMRKAHLENRKPAFKVIYFNAWENDFYEDPLLPLAHEIEKQSQDGSKDLLETAGKIIKQSAKFTNIILNDVVKDATKT